MAFVSSIGERHYFHIDRYIGSDANLKVWVYVTLDDIETVTTAGYFADWRGPEPFPGDVLRIYHVTDRDDLTSTDAVELFSVVQWNVSYVYLGSGLRANVGVPSARGVYTDVAPPGANIYRIRDKLLVGGGVDAWDGYNYSEGVTTGSKIFDKDVASRYLEKGASLVSISEVGAVGGLFASFTADGDNLSTDPSSIAIGAVGWCDHVGPQDISQVEADFPSSWGAYIEAHRDQDCGPGLIEFELVNHGDEDAIMTSYGVRGTNIQRAINYFAVGTGAASALTVFDSTAFMVLTGNGAKARSGIVFLNGSLTGQTGDGTGAGRAIELARDMEIVQVYGTAVANRGGTIRFEGSTHQTAARQIFTAGFWRIQGPESDGTTYDNLFSVIIPNLTGAQTALGLTISPQVAGTGYVLLSPAGADTNIATRIAGKGASGVLISGADLTAKVNVNNTGIGFFATTPVARPTGVAVTAEGVHAALVTLGLITA